MTTVCPPDTFSVFARSYLVARGPLLPFSANSRLVPVRYFPVLPGPGERATSRAGGDRRTPGCRTIAHWHVSHDVSPDTTYIMPAACNGAFANENYIQPYDAPRGPA